MNVAFFSKLTDKFYCTFNNYYRLLLHCGNPSPHHKHSQSPVTPRFLVLDRPLP